MLGELLALPLMRPKGNSVGDVGREGPRGIHGVGDQQLPSLHPSPLLTPPSLVPAPRPPNTSLPHLCHETCDSGHVASIEQARCQFLSGEPGIWETCGVQPPAPPPQTAQGWVNNEKVGEKCAKPQGTWDESATLGGPVLPPFDILSTFPWGPPAVSRPHISGLGRGCRSAAAAHSAPTPALHLRCVTALAAQATASAAHGCTPSEGRANVAMLSVPPSHVRCPEYIRNSPADVEHWEGRGATGRQAAPVRRCKAFQNTSLQCECRENRAL